MNPFDTAASVTLGILAGGHASRLGGCDKAWTTYHGKPLIQRAVSSLEDGFAARLISANRNMDRYHELGLTAVADRIPGFPGPLAGIDALLARCESALLLTVPVDLRTIPRDLLVRLFGAGGWGAVAEDASGVQPLVTLWPVAPARIAVREALGRGDGAVHRVVKALELPVVRFGNSHFGNLNVPEDFDA